MDRALDAGRFDWPCVFGVRWLDEGTEDGAWEISWGAHKAQGFTVEEAARKVLAALLAERYPALSVTQFDVWQDGKLGLYAGPGGELKTYADFARHRFDPGIEKGARRRIFDIERKLFFDVEVVKATKNQVVHRVLGNPAEYSMKPDKFRAAVAEACLRETGDELRAGAILEAKQ